LDEAIASLQQAVEIQPDLIDARTSLGDLSVAKGDLAAAVNHYAEAVKRDPKSAYATAKLAWYLATIPNRYPTDVPLKLIQRVTSATTEPSAQLLDVLAAAQAHAGQFDEAIATLQRAQKQLPPESPLRAELQDRLRQYEQRQPYRLPGVTP
jgi:tetratricopeptide (TPR) repeat protein